MSVTEKDKQYDQIIADIVPNGFRHEKKDSICENGMPTNIQDHYESLATLSEEDLDAKAELGQLFKV